MDNGFHSIVTRNDTTYECKIFGSSRHSMLYVWTVDGNGFRNLFHTSRHTSYSDAYETYLRVAFLD